jgi:hypothetical protein
MKNQGNGKEKNEILTPHQQSLEDLMNFSHEPAS